MLLPFIPVFLSYCPPKIKENLDELRAFFVFAGQTRINLLISQDSIWEEGYVGDEKDS